MQRNESMPLGNLRTGDRFYFKGDKKKRVYQTTGAKCPKPYVGYTSNPNSKTPQHFERRESAFKWVVFLRHTIPAPGEEWSLEDLAKNDVFFIVDDVVTEYVKDDEYPGDNYWCYALPNNKQKLFHKAIRVVFVRKGEEVKA